MSWLHSLFAVEKKEIKLLNIMSNDIQSIYLMFVTDQTPDRRSICMNMHALNFTKYASSFKLGVYNNATFRYK